jgi:hypothetical protein
MRTPAAHGLEELFSAVLERFLQPMCSGCVSRGWDSKFLRIFLLNPNLLLAHRKRCSEGTDEAQKTSHWHPDFNSNIQNLRVFIFQTDGRTDERMNGYADRQTEKLIRCGLGNLINSPRLTWRNRRLPSPTRIYLFLRPSFCPSIRAKRGIWIKRVLIRKIGNFSFSVHWRNTTTESS